MIDLLGLVHIRKSTHVHNERTVCNEVQGKYGSWTNSYREVGSSPTIATGWVVRLKVGRPSLIYKNYKL